MKAFSTTMLVNAPAERLWRILTDVAAWKNWNTTVDKVEGTAALGQKVTVHAKISPGRAFPVKVAEFLPPHKMVWKGGMPLGLFTGQRTYLLTPQSDGKTLFQMDEVFSGLMSPLITPSIPNLQPAFDEFAQCLKAEAEKR